MITPGTYTLLDAGAERVTIASLDGTTELVEMLAQAMRLARATTPGTRSVYVHAGAEPPHVSQLASDPQMPLSWMTYRVRDRVLIRQSPSGTVFFCGVPEYPGRYSERLVRWHLVSFILGGLLALLSNRLLLIHAALLVGADGRAHLLAGHGGAGKSTAVARAPPPWRAIADDMVAAVPAGNGWSVIPLPTWSVFDRDPDEPHSIETTRAYPLAGLWFIEQSSTDGARALAPTEAVSRLWGNAYELYGLHVDRFNPEDLLRLKSDILRHAIRVVTTTPCRALRVSRDGHFWEYLERT